LIEGVLQLIEEQDFGVGVADGIVPVQTVDAVIEAI
jgi:hypothetical protein